MNFFKNTFNKMFGKEEETKKNTDHMQEVDVPEDSLRKIFDLSTQFIAESKQPVPDEVKLQLYGYYKQATVGDCKTEKPAIWEMVAKAKWQAWNALKGMSAANAMKNYIAWASKADPSVSAKIVADLQGEDYEQNHQHQQHTCHMHKVQTTALKKVEQKDYSSTYSHPYFRPIEKGEQIPAITRQLLLQTNNSPKVYPLHFAIDKEREELVPQFLAILSVQDIQKMQDEQGTGILQYAQLIQNEVILKLVRQKLAK